MTKVRKPSLSTFNAIEYLLSQVLAGLIDGDPLIGLYLLLHHDLGSLQIEDQLARLHMPEYDAHALGLGGEGKVCQDVVFLK